MKLKPKQCRELFPEYRRIEESTRWRPLPRASELYEFEARHDENPLVAAIHAEEESRLAAFRTLNDGDFQRLLDHTSSKDVRRRTALKLLDALFRASHITSW